MKTLRTLILPVAAGLVFLAGCGDYNPDLPDPITAQGYVNDGWTAYAAGNYALALENFQAAIEADVTYPAGYLGAGWASINQSDYWVIADNYFFMAEQLSSGHAPLVMFSEQLVQDTNWTVFQCVDPVLPDSVMEVIGALGETWYDWPAAGDTTVIDAVTIGAYLYGAAPFATYGPDYGAMNFTYRFHTSEPNVAAMLTTFNNFSNVSCPVDSIVADGSGGYWVYVMGDYTAVTQGDLVYRTWIMADNVMTYDYMTFTPGGLDQDTYDALAGSVMLQHVRGDNGDPLLASAAAIALDRELDAYDFGAGTPHDAVLDMSMAQIKGMAASSVFTTTWFRYAWFLCLTEGYGLDLLPTRDDFVFALMQVIESMLTS
jgi:hypothetical protein